MFGDHYIWIHISISLNVVYSWSWGCDNGICRKNSIPYESKTYSSLELCHLMCTNYLNIWPQPTGTVQSLKNVVNLNTKDIKFHIEGPSETESYLMQTIDYFKEKLRTEEPFSCEGNLFSVKIVLQPTSSDLSLGLNTKESYSLEIGAEKLVSINITAQTVFGIRHGLETLLQLFVPYDKGDQKCLATLSYVQIIDKPVYHHRGLLLDTSRNYLKVESIKRTIDGMAASKLNVLHWHITDSQSFPLESPRLPNMTKYGAYDQKKTYSQNDIRSLVDYAKVRGVRLLLEIDGPSHAGNGWQWGPEAGLGNIAVCINKQPWRSFCIQPPCGQLNPANPNLYWALGQLYRDIRDVLPDTGMFHMGGDEVFINCWNSTQEIIDYLADKPLTNETFLDLWGEYQKKALDAFDGAVGHHDTSIVVWTSHLTNPDVIQKYLPKDRYIIQTWILEENIDLITSLLQLGYRIIVSTKDRWYLDHGFWGSTSYYKWKTVYENKMYSYSHEALLGGEVCMWGELVDDNNMDSRIWPRAAAAAERLWSNPRNSANVAQNRFFSQTKRLKKRGIRADPVTPEWCVQNEGDCSTYL